MLGIGFLRGPSAEVYSKTPSRQIGSFLIGLIAGVHAAYSSLALRAFPRPLLSPVLRFQRDGWKTVLFDSVEIIDCGNAPEIVVFGGHLGDPVGSCLQRLDGSRVTTFEPIAEFAKVLRERFRDCAVVVHEFGVSSYWAPPRTLAPGETLDCQSV